MKKPIRRNSNDLVSIDRKIQKCIIFFKKYKTDIFHNFYIEAIYIINKGLEQNIDIYRFLIVGTSYIKVP